MPNYRRDQNHYTAFCKCLKINRVHKIQIYLTTVASGLKLSAFDKMSIARWPTESSADTLSHKIDCSNQEAKRDYYIYKKKNCKISVIWRRQGVFYHQYLRKYHLPLYKLIVSLSERTTLYLTSF